MFRIQRSKGLFISTFLLLFTACSFNDGETGTMRVSLTDAPADYQQVNIEIHQVLVKKVEAETEADTSAEETEGMDDEGLENSGWEVVFNDTLMVNLLDYQNGETLNLGEVELESGQYEEIRLVLGDSNTVVLQNGNSVSLKTPSAQTSGLKIKINAAIDADEFYELILDFDASQSVVARGNGAYNLKPVIRVIEPEDNGSISGVVMPLDANPWVYAIANSDTVGTQADEEGNFNIIGLEEGDYEVLFRPTNEAYADSSITIRLEEEDEFAIADTVYLETMN